MFEFAIINIPGHSSFYEAELEVAEDQIETAKETLKQWLATRELTVYSKEEFNAYVEVLDLEANDRLDFSDPKSWDVIGKRIAD